MMAGQTIESYADLPLVRRNGSGRLHVCSVHCPGICGADWRASFGMSRVPGPADWRARPEAKAAS